MSAAVHPFTPAFSEDAIRQLHERLERTRFPDPETVEDWSQGAQLMRSAFAQLDLPVGPAPASTAAEVG